MKRGRLIGNLILVLFPAFFCLALATSVVLGYECNDDYLVGEFLKCPKIFFRLSVYFKAHFQPLLPGLKMILPILTVSWYGLSLPFVFVFLSRISRLLFFRGRANG